ncbi:DUF4865 family protein [Frankia sp. ACN1ag]|uniref:DUF4865 family protein n=1 Tax=Frankia sp. ACN1ag TaxID=102891 RepID=UPI0006DCDE1A|nr:DUF4865 family protein [Frankia sp. ACN1ag]KQC37769.1 hypothetical protein UK82_14335 [Frankia sp. ACN1ag]
MYAMQYTITLPADYEMAIIRRRVADTGHALDDRAGLALKAYAIRERGVAGAAVNQYAPFYLWHDAGAMGRFLVGGGGFERIIGSFGRPAVAHGTVLAAVTGSASQTGLTSQVDSASQTGPVSQTGPARPRDGGASPPAASAASPTAASRRVSALPADADTLDDGSGSGLAAHVAREIDALAALAGRAGVHTAALTLDPRRWELTRFVLWADAAAAAGDGEATERYEVLHVSAPGAAPLPSGRGW